MLKRMKLGRVAPELMQAYREDELTLECLMAFTLTDDHRRQLKVYQIASVLAEERSRPHPGLPHREDDRRGQQAGPLRRAGRLHGSRRHQPDRSVRARRSTSRNRPCWTDLATEKLDAIRRELEAEGWGWIEISPDRDHAFIAKCGRLQPVLIDAPSGLDGAARPDPRRAGTPSSRPSMPRRMKPTVLPSSRSTAMSAAMRPDRGDAVRLCRFRPRC